MAFLPWSDLYLSSPLLPVDEREGQKERHIAEPDRLLPDSAADKSTGRRTCDKDKINPIKMQSGPFLTAVMLKLSQ